MKVVEEEWNFTWMLKKDQKRRGMNDFQYHALRDLDIQTSRTKVTNAQFSICSEGHLKAMFMCKQNLSRKMSQKQKDRRES